MRALDDYKRKRNFTRTPEPAGGEDAARHPPGTSLEGGEFVIQKHAASRLHYDLRLEKDGVFISWAVPKGPSLDPGERRLAVKVEDHPLEYGDFEGVIPSGEYGGGTVMLWDRGRWAPLERKSKAKENKNEEDHIDFVLVGQKLRGAWTLVRTAAKPGEEADTWLLIKRRDNAAGESKITDLSVATGRTMEQIAADKSRTWNRSGETTPDRREVPNPAALEGARKRKLPDTPQAALATLAKEAPAGDQWLQEIKFDGYRILARCEEGKVRLISRNGKDWTRRFPEIAELLKNLPAESAVLDGEIVAYAADGTSSFRGLQEALSIGNSQHLVYQVFDLQHLGGYDLGAVPLRQRKSALRKLLTAASFTNTGSIRYTDHIDGQGPAFAEQACRLGLEGIICKRAEGRYPQGRSKDWLKVKCTGREELLICGYTDPGGSRSGFGSLLLGAWHGDELVYTGKVGTGFSDRDLRQLHGRLRKLELEVSPCANPPAEKGLHWVAPQLIAEVEFTEWTRDGMLRHPSFRGLREDRDSKDIRLPPGAPEPQQSARAKKIPLPTTAAPRRRSAKGKVQDSAEVAGVTLTNASRILYPECGITKLALAEYYEEIADWMLPQLAFRPLSLVRCPEGHTGECFFQKHPRQTLTKSIPRVMIEEKDGRSPYLYVQSITDVIALVQFGALELHVWGSRVEDVERPDILVFDLDPGPDLPFSELLRIARDLRDRLADLGLTSFPRTTGGKGLHLVVPVEPARGWETIKNFCQGIAQQQAQADRLRVTSNMAKSRRRGRVFLDYLRNGRGATAISSFSSRARPGAPVAVPVAWDELNEALRPDRYTVENLRRRLSVLSSDPWEGFEAARRPITEKMLQAVGLS